MSNSRHPTTKHRKSRTISGSVVPFDPLRRGEAWLCLTKGIFSCAEILSHVLKSTGPAHVYIASWSIGLGESAFLGGLIRSGSALTMTLLLDRSWPTRREAIFVETLIREVGAENIRIMRTHAKIIVVRNDQWGVVVRGSLNFNPNPRLEQFDMEENPKLADWAIAQVFDGPVQSLPDILHPDTHRMEKYFLDLFDDGSIPDSEDLLEWNPDDETPLPDEIELIETRVKP